MSRHSCRNPTPATERIALSRRSRLRSDGCTIVVTDCFVCFAINYVNKLVSSLCEWTCNSYIVSRHRRRNLTPTTERISFLSWCRFWGDCCTILYFVRLIHFAIHHICQFIFVDGERPRNRHVVCRHGGWNLTPTRECITFLSGSGLWSDSRTFLYRVCLIKNAINKIGKCIAGTSSHYEFSVHIANVVVLSLSTRYGHWVFARLTIHRCLTSNNRLLCEYGIGLIQLPPFIAQRELWHRITFSLSIGSCLDG